jgi:hypothetical protein
MSRQPDVRRFFVERVGAFSGTQPMLKLPRRHRLRIANGSANARAGDFAGYPPNSD